MNPTGPFDQDQLLNPPKLEPKPLEEKDFIQNSRTWGALPVWIWIFLLCLLILTVLGTWNWYQSAYIDRKDEKPFLDVTNRQFSVFLWQFPSYLRIHSPIKTGYLPGFESNGEGVQLGAVENKVSAPPDLLFLYHTWSRLLQPYYIERPINPKSFEEFLNQTQEWLPQYWKNAPHEYVELIDKQAYLEMDVLQSLPKEKLPMVVKLAYQGWKNYFEEGPDINALEPSYADIKEFLNQYPHYQRNYWRNIDKVANQQVAGINYLSSLIHDNADPEEKVPSNQLAPFLKVALFNFQQAKQGK